MMLRDWVEKQARRFTEVQFGVSKTRADGPTFQTLLELIPRKDSKILDIGCCDGGVVLKLREMGYDAMGVDHPRVIEMVTRDNLQRSQYFYGLDLETERGPWIEEFDLVIATDVIEHLLHDYEFLEKIHRWLRLGGLVYLTTKKGDPPEDQHARHYHEETLRKLMDYAGFQVEVEVEESAVRATGRKV